MDTLEQEIIDKFQQLEPEAKQRVLHTLNASAKDDLGAAILHLKSPLEGPHLPAEQSSLHGLSGLSGCGVAHCYGRH
jgi:hypothetical protein